MASGQKKSKKGLVIGIIVAVLVLGAIGSAANKNKDEDSSSSKNEIVSVNSSNGSEGGKEITNSKNDTSKKDDEEPAKDTAAVATIDEQILWETDDIKITANGLDEDDLWGTAINVLVENKSDKDIGIGCDALIVNDYMINDLTSIQVAAGKKTNDDITLYTSSLKAAGIENVGKIEMYLHTYDSDSFETIESSDCITINTSESKNTDTTNSIDGVTLYEQDGVKIVGQYVDDSSFWGAAVLLYIENNSGKNIIVQNEDLSVNGFTMTSIFSSTIYANKKTFDDITLLNTELEKNDITSIDTIETEFKILDENFQEIGNSGKVSFSTTK